MPPDTADVRTDQDVLRSRRADELRRRPRFFRSGMLRLAVFITAIGLGMWIYAMVTAPAGAASGGSGATALATGLAPSTSAPAAAPRLIDQGSPALFRFGISFVIAFFLAWLLRAFIKWTLLIAGAIGVLIVVLKKTGVITLDWNSVEGQVQHGVELAQQEAGRVKQFVLGYVPSSCSAVAGLFFGTRQKA